MKAVFIALQLILSIPLWGKSPLVDVSVSVNGKVETVASGGVLSVYDGDKIMIKGATIQSGQAYGIINLVGFRQSHSNNPFDDTDKLVLVAESLGKAWSVGGRGELYSIHVITESYVHGSITLRILTPKVNSITYRVNGAATTIAPNQEIRLQTTDEFSLEEVKANFDVRSPSFRYAVETRKDGQRQMVFSRYQKKVATFPIKAY